MFYTVWGALSSTSVWIKSFNPSVLSPTFHWNQLSSDFLSLANGFKQHVGGGERLRWSFWENLFSPISYIGTMWKKNQPATLTSIFKTLALWSSTTVTVYTVTGFLATQPFLPWYLKGKFIKRVTRQLKCAAVNFHHLFWKETCESHRGSYVCYLVTAVGLFIQLHF